MKARSWRKVAHEHRPQVRFALSQQVRERLLDPAALKRRETFADWSWLPCEGGGRTYCRAEDDAATSDQLRTKIGGDAGGAYQPFLPLMVDELARFFQGHETHFALTPRS